MDIDQLLNKRVALPPLQPLPADLPESPRCHSARPPIPRPAPAEASGDDDDGGRSNPYTLMDDLSIFKVVAMYYGTGFHGKVPWSFWQFYKRATGSTRSNSSLYHHWNGAMKKKYEAFISAGRLAECIVWLETAVMAEQAPGPLPPVNVPHTGMPLYHSMSGPSIPLSREHVCRPEAPRTLTRTASCFQEGDFPFAQRMRH